MNQLSQWWQQLVAFSQQEDTQWAIHFIMISFASIVIWFIWRAIYGRLLRTADKTAVKWDDAVILALKSPLSTLILGWPLVIGLGLLLEAVFQKNVEWLSTLKIFFVCLMILWALLRFINQAEEIFTEKSKYDITTIQILSKIAKLTVILFIALTFMQSAGLSLSGLLTFGGVSGLIIGYAAKDLLSNFFGGMVIYLDRPFKIGDWIRSPDRDIEGTVEHIGWRMTTVRTFDKRPLYIPNSIFTMITVENPSRMTNRRIKETIGLRYQDADKMAVIVDDIKHMLYEHPEIDNNTTTIVNFDVYGPSSLDIFLYTFTKTIEWVRFHEIKQDVLLKIFDIIKKHDADIAFPTRTLHMESVPDGMMVGTQGIGKSAH